MENNICREINDFNKELKPYCRELTYEETKEIADSERRGIRRSCKVLLFLTVLCLAVTLILATDTILTFVNLLYKIPRYTIFESVNTVIGIIVEFILLIILLCLYKFISKMHKESRKELKELEENPLVTANRYEIFTAFVLCKETVHHSVRGEPDSYCLVTTTPDVGSDRVLKLRCTDDMGIRIKIGEQITVIKQKEAQSLHDFVIMTPKREM